MRLTRASWAALLLVGLAGCRNADGREQLPPPNGSGAPPPLVIPAVASAALETSSSTTDRLVVTGTAAPVKEAKVGPKTTGVVAAMRVEEGDTVKKGQLLFRLSAANQALAVNQAQAALASALVGQTTAKTELDRIKTLHERGSVAPAAVDQARAAVASARQATADAAVVSPISGVVSRRLASVGDTVSMMPPTVVLIIQDISKLEVRGRVPETMLAKLEPGSPIRVRFPAVKQERTVEIERISPSVDPMTRTIEVVALVPNEDRSLKAGMLVELDFSDTSGASATPAASASAGSAKERKAAGK